MSRTRQVDKKVQVVFEGGCAASRRKHDANFIVSIRKLLQEV